MPKAGKSEKPISSDKRPSEARRKLRKARFWPATKSRLSSGASRRRSAAQPPMICSWLNRPVVVSRPVDAEALARAGIEAFAVVADRQAALEAEGAGQVGIDPGERAAGADLVDQDAGVRVEIFAEHVEEPVIGAGRQRRHRNQAELAAVLARKKAQRAVLRVARVGHQAGVAGLVHADRVKDLVHDDRGFGGQERRVGQSAGGKARRRCEGSRQKKGRSGASSTSAAWTHRRKAAGIGCPMLLQLSATAKDRGPRRIPQGTLALQAAVEPSSKPSAKSGGFAVTRQDTESTCARIRSITRGLVLPKAQGECRCGPPACQVKLENARAIR